MRLVAVGDNVVDCYPQLGLMFPGGNALGVAVHGRRSGAVAGYVGAVGDDAAGQMTRAALAAERVDTTRLRVLPGPTATATVLSVDGERTFLGNDKGVSLIRLDEADLAYLASFDVTHSTCYSRLEEQVPVMARRTALSYDFSDRREPRYAGPLLPHLFLATFSGADLSAHDAEELVRWAHRQGARHVLLTRGPHGSLLHDGDRIHRQPAPSTAVVDTLGAGDCFIARTLVGLVRGEPVPQILAAAADAAAATCRRPGSFGHGAALPPGSRLPDTIVDVSHVFLNR